MIKSNLQIFTKELYAGNEQILPCLGRVLLTCFTLTLGLLLIVFNGIIIILTFI